MNISFPEAGEVAAAVLCLTDFVSWLTRIIVPARTRASRKLKPRNLMHPSFRRQRPGKRRAAGASYVLHQNENFTENCSCRGFMAVRGKPKFGLGVAGMNSPVPMGVRATEPPGTEIPPFGQFTA